jgi:hypothetical protein
MYVQVRSRAADQSLGTNTLSALIVSKAVDAIDIVSGFAASDGANTGASSPLPGSGRLRVGADLFAVLLLGAVQTQFGVTIVQSCHRSRRPLKCQFPGPSGQPDRRGPCHRRRAGTQGVDVPPLLPRWGTRRLHHLRVCLDRRLHPVRQLWHRRNEPKRQLPHRQHRAVRRHRC